MSSDFARLAALSRVERVERARKAKELNLRKRVYSRQRELMREAGISELHYDPVKRKMQPIPPFYHKTLNNPVANRTDRYKLFVFLWLNGVSPPIAAKIILSWWELDRTRLLTDPFSNIVKHTSEMVGVAEGPPSLAMYTMHKVWHYDLIHGRWDRFDGNYLDWRRQFHPVPTPAQQAHRWVLDYPDSDDEIDSEEDY